jgi:hypothetical protein
LVSYALVGIQFMKKINSAVVAIAALGALALSSCETATGTGALVGAATGAAIGSAAGGHHGYYHHGGSAEGALAGAAIGAAAGALVGAAIDADERGYYDGHPGSYYPYARHAGGPGLYRSPYPPHVVMNLRGVPRGAVVRDPENGRLFRKP